MWQASSIDPEWTVHVHENAQMGRGRLSQKKRFFETQAWSLMQQIINVRGVQRNPNREKWKETHCFSLKCYAHSPFFVQRATFFSKMCTMWPHTNYYGGAGPHAPAYCSRRGSLSLFFVKNTQESVCVKAAAGWNHDPLINNDNKKKGH